MAKISQSIAGTRKKTPASGRPARPSAHGRKNSVAAAGAKSGTRSRGKTGSNGPDQPPEKITTKFTFYSNPTLTLACVPAGTPVLFSLDAAAHLTGVHPDMLGYYCRLGLIENSGGAWEAEILFNENALHEIRRIEHYRRHLGVSRRALPLICDLRREGERRQIELHFLRYP